MKGAPDVIVPSGPAPKLDGRIEDGEWDGGYAFTVLRRGREVASGRILRAGRDLYLSITSRMDAYGLSVRMAFADPGSGRRVLIEVTPLNPPRPPVLVHAFRPDGRQDRKSAATCDARFLLNKDGTFAAEIKLPLDVLEIGRPPKAYKFFLQLFSEFQGNLAAFPGTAQSRAGHPQLSPFMPAKDWGIHVKAAPDAINEAIALLEGLWWELNKVPGKPPLLSPYLGTRDGRRNDVELAALQTRLERLKREYPDYASLDGELVRVFIGRNDLEGALGSLAAMAKKSPLLAEVDYHVQFRARLLNDLGRFDEAIALLESKRDVFKGKAGVIAGLTAALRAQRDDWKRELDYRKADAKPGDLPRVLLETNRGKILLELFEDDVPNAVACFIEQVEAKYYDNTRFFWCEASSRAEGGDPLTRNGNKHDDGYGGPKHPIETELGRRLHFPFTVSWVDKRGTYDTEGGNFRIALVPLAALNGFRTVFGRVIEGQEVARSLAYYDTLEKAVVQRKRDHPYKAVRR